MTDWLDRYQAHHFAMAKTHGYRPTRRARLALWIVMLTPTARQIQRRHRQGRGVHEMNE